MTNEMKIAELNEQITEWRRQQEMIEDMINAAHERIDQLGGTEYWMAKFKVEKAEAEAV